MRLLLAIAGLLAATSLVLAACGGAPSASASSATKTTAKASTKTPAKASTKTPAGSTARSAFQAYTSCLAQHGVTLTLPSRGGQGFRRPSSASPPSTTHSRTTRPPGSGFAGRFPLPKGVSAAKFAAAQKACRSKLPARGSFGGFGGFGGANSQAFAAYRNCLKVNGVTLPSRPSSSSGGARSTPPTTTAASRAKFAAAEKACANLLPRRGSSSTSSTTVKGD